MTANNRPASRDADPDRQGQRPRGAHRRRTRAEDPEPRGTDEMLLIMAMALCAELGQLEQGRTLPPEDSPSADMISQLPGRTAVCQPPADTIRGMIGALVERCALVSAQPESVVWSQLEGLGLAERLRD